MKQLTTLLCLLSPFCLFADETVLLNFTETPSEVKWMTVNDNVMGGKSKGGFRIDKTSGLLEFSGSTNTDGGGFSSIRTENRDWQIGEATGIFVRFRGDARSYQADLRKKGDRSWVPVAYRAAITATDTATDQDGWQTVRIPFADFKPTRFGRKVGGSPITPSEIGAIGFMIYDKLDGAFKFEVDQIGVYTESPTVPDEMPPLETAF